MRPRLVVTVLVVLFAAVPVVSVGHAGATTVPMCTGIPATKWLTTPGKLTGTSGPDVLVGTDGDDLIYGLSGDDLICSHPDGSQTFDDDAVYGGDGNDIILGPEGAGGIDTVDGGSGTDRCIDPDANDVSRGCDA